MTGAAWPSNLLTVDGDDEHEDPEDEVELRARSTSRKSSEPSLAPAAATTDPEDVHNGAKAMLRKALHADSLTNGSTVPKSSTTRMTLTYAAPACATTSIRCAECAVMAVTYASR